MHIVLAIVIACIFHPVCIKIIFYNMGGNFIYVHSDTMFINLKHLCLSPYFQPFCT